MTTNIIENKFQRFSTLSFQQNTISLCCQRPKIGIVSIVTYQYRKKIYSNRCFMPKRIGLISYSGRTCSPTFIDTTSNFIFHSLSTQHTIKGAVLRSITVIQILTTDTFISLTFLIPSFFPSLLFRKMLKIRAEFVNFILAI